MWSHGLLSLYRSLTRHRLYAVLNIMGLAVGIAVFLVFSLYVTFEESFERWIPGADKIYVVRASWLLPGHAMDTEDQTMGGLLDELLEDHPHLQGTRLWTVNANIRQGALVSGEDLELVDPTFFSVFNLPLAAGSRRLVSPGDLLLTEARARRYFGASDPIGRTLTLTLLGQSRTYRVAGVLKDPPKSTDLSFDFVALLTPDLVPQGPSWRHWGNSTLSTYLRFDAPAQARAFDGGLDAFTDARAVRDMGSFAHRTLKLRTQALLGLHLNNPRDAVVVATLGVVGLLTLILAGVNYVNLATARAGLRAKEVALRKVMGATEATLLLQYMAEAVATSALAAIIGLALCEVAVPAVNAAGGLSLKIRYFEPDGVLPLLVGVILALGLGAGVYPALILSRFRAAAVLASARTPGGGRAGGRVREVLVVFQFSIAVAFTIATGVILAQSRYLRHADIGFKRDGLVIVTSFHDQQVTTAQRAALLDLWRAVPGVSSVTTADIAPGNDDSTSASNFKRPGGTGDGPTFNFVTTGRGFLETYQGRLLAGRALSDRFGLDEEAAPVGLSVGLRQSLHDGAVRNVVLNAAAAKVFGFASPAAAVGQLIEKGADDGGFRPLRVVGVVTDIRFRSPKTKVPATIYFYMSHDIADAMAAVRYAGVDPKATLAQMRRVWTAVAPQAPFRARTIEDNLAPYYRADDQRGRLFTFGAALAVGIGCLGLYGMASFSTARRIKEIGIRKTLGASSFDVLRLLVGQFLRPVLFANLLAWPLAFSAMQQWLSGFDQKIALTPLYFIAAALLTLVIAVATVAGQSLAVARAEPARALRRE